MGSDARLVNPLDALPPFRNLSPGPPDSLPSLAQLGCDIPSSAADSSSSSSWTAVNHLVQSESVDSYPDRAPGNIDADINHHPIASTASHLPQLNSHISPLRPKSTSHLGRPAKRPKLAPKFRQDSVTAESPSPKVPSEASPEYSQTVSVIKEASFTPHSSEVIKLAPSSVPGASFQGLGASHPPRAAIHEQHHQNINPYPPQQYPAVNDPRTAKPSIRARKPRTTLPRDTSASGPLSPLSLPKRATRPRRRRTAKPVPLPAVPTVGDNKAPSASDRMAQMAPPPGPSHVSPYASNVESNGHRKMSNPSVIKGSSGQPSEARLFSLPSLNGSWNAESKVTVVSNGSVVHTTGGSPQPEPIYSATNPSPSHTADRSLAEPEPSSEWPGRCRVCRELYEPPSLLLALEKREIEMRQKPEFSDNTEDFADFIRDFPQVRASHYNEWAQQHHHDAASLGASNGADAPSGLEEVVSGPNKRKRTLDDDPRSRARQPGYSIIEVTERRPGYVLIETISGDNVWVTEGVARILTNGVPSEPHERPKADPYNMWYDPSLEKKETNRKRKRLSGTEIAQNPRSLQERKLEEKESSPSVPPTRKRSPGAAPLNHILHP